MRPADLRRMMSSQERDKPGRCWRGDYLTEYDLELATNEVREGSLRMKMDTRDAYGCRGSSGTRVTDAKEWKMLQAIRFPECRVRELGDRSCTGEIIFFFDLLIRPSHPLPHVRTLNRSCRVVGVVNVSCQRLSQTAYSRRFYNIIRRKGYDTYALLLYNFQVLFHREQGNLKTLMYTVCRCIYVYLRDS